MLFWSFAALHEDHGIPPSLSFGIYGYHLYYYPFSPRRLINRRQKRTFDILHLEKHEEDSLPSSALFRALYEWCNDAIDCVLAISNSIQNFK